MVEADSIYVVFPKTYSNYNIYHGVITLIIIMSYNCISTIDIDDEYSRDNDVVFSDKNTKF